MICSGLSVAVNCTSKTWVVAVGVVVSAAEPSESSKVMSASIVYSILRIVSSASPARAASSRTGMSPRDRRSAAPSASPRARSSSVNASLTTTGSYSTAITIPG